MEKENKNEAPPVQEEQLSKNMRFYDKFRSVPDTAKKPITDGRLRGKTDVNPMWRIKVLTEVFGPCGFGWKYVEKRKWLEQGDNDTVAAFVDVDLYVKDPETGQWSEPIPGTGGNIFRRKEGSGKNYIDDDCYKKALTDAISIAMKFLGVAADVFYEKDDTSKYDTAPPAAENQQGQQQKPTVRERTEPAELPWLNPSNPHWNKSVTIVMSTQDGPDDILKRILKHYRITDEDFNNLLKQAGRIQENETFQSALGEDEDIPF